MKYIIFFLAISCPLVICAQDNDPVFVMNNPEGHYSNIQKVLVTNDNITAITLGRDKSICLWDIRSSKLIKKLWLDIGENEKGRFIDADIDPNSNLLAVARINSEGIPVVNLLDLDKSKVVGSFGGFSNDLGFVKFDPNSKFIITGTAQVVNSTRVEPIKLWKIPGYTEKSFFITQPSAQIEGGPIHDICFYDEGSKLILLNLYGKNDGIDIIHNVNAIPEYTLRNIKPIITTDGHVRFLGAIGKVLNVEHDGKILSIDKSGNSEALYQLINSGKRRVGDSTASDVFVSKTGLIAYLKVRVVGTNKRFAAIIEMKDQPRITFYPYDFREVVFTSDSAFLGLNTKELKHINFISKEEFTISTRSGFLRHDPIGFGPGMIIAFDSLNKTFDFERLLFTNGSKTKGFSYKKTSYNGKTAEQGSRDEPVNVNGKSFYYYPPNYELNEYSFLNNGNLLLNFQGYRNYWSSTLLYDISNISNRWPIKEIKGINGALSGITPAPDISSDMFATRDVDGMLSLYDEHSSHQTRRFKEATPSIHLRVSGLTFLKKQENG